MDGWIAVVGWGCWLEEWCDISENGIQVVDITVEGPEDVEDVRGNR